MDTFNLFSWSDLRASDIEIVSPSGNLLSPTLLFLFCIGIVVLDRTRLKRIKRFIARSNRI